MMAGTFDIFAGELKDNTGKVVIAKGTTLKQTDVTLESMNYLVEGVIGKVLSGAPSATPARALPIRSSCSAWKAGATRWNALLLPAAGAGRRRAAVRPVRRPVAGTTRCEAWTLLFKGAFGDAFSWQNTLQRAAPLMLTGTVRGAAGAGRADRHRRRGRAGAAAAWRRRPCRYCAAAATGVAGTALLLLAAAAGRRRLDRRWPAVLRQWRGVNETIASLLLGYIAIALFKHLVEGPLRDPASLNKPSTLAAAPRRCGMRRHRRAARCTGAWCSASWPACASPVACRHHARLCGARWWAATAAPPGWLGLPAGRLIVTACAAGRRRGRAGWRHRGGGRARRGQRHR
jgi:hypothetical protein